MRWLTVIIVALVCYSFIGTNPIKTTINLKRDTVPTGAVPQLFGSKLYEFRNYVLIDSFLMVMGGDTFAIPRWPALKYKNSDNRWYGYHGTRWRAFLNGTDTISLSNRINAAFGVPVDSSKYIANVIPKSRVSQINFFGNSITQYQNATPNDSAYNRLIADSLKAYWQNYALSATGIVYALKLHDSLISGVDNNAATSVMVGYNDVRNITSGKEIRTYQKIASGLKGMFLNHFANMYITAGTTPPDTSVTRYGTWTTGLDAMQWTGKTKNAASTTTLNDSIVWKCQPATTVGVNLIAGDSLLYNHSIVEIFVDNVSYGQYNTNNIADSISVYGSPPNTRISYPIIIGGLSNTPHTVKLVNKASRIMYVDYFTTLDTKKPSFIMFHNINPANGYAGLQGAANIRIDSMYLTLPAGFPVLVVKTNNFWTYPADMSVDDVHPNNRGHYQIYEAFRSVYDSSIASIGTVQFDGRNLWVSGGGSMQKLLNASDAWTKGDAALNVAGYVNVPYNMSYKQAGVDILKTNHLFNTSVGRNSMVALTNGVSNTGVGERSLASVTTGGGNIGVGDYALYTATSASNNVAIGYQALYANTADRNTSVGSEALRNNTTGIENVAMGYSTLYSATSASSNTAIGYSAASNLTGGENSILGAHALEAATNSLGNVAIGLNSMRNTGAASYNVIIGRYAGFFHDSGDGNVGIGNGSLYGTSTAKSYNTAIGYGTLGSIDGGNGNIAIGRDAGNSITTGNNNIVIGYDIDAPNATGNNQLTIGNLIYGTSLDGIGTGVSTGSIGIGVASPNYKFDVNGTMGANGGIHSYGTGSGFNLTSRASGAFVWGVYADNDATKFFDIASTKDRIKFWHRGGMTLSNSDETSPVYAGRTLDVHGSVAIEKDSIPTLSTISSQYVLVVDTAATAADSNLVKRISVANLFAGNSYTFSNGLTESAGAVTLGGTLTANTTIDGGSSFTTTFTGSRTSTNSTLLAENVSSGRGITGSSGSGIGVVGSSTTNTGVFAQSSSGSGLLGLSSSGVGVAAQSTTGQGLTVLSPNTNGAANIAANPSSTNTTHTVMKLTRLSTSAGANNIAGALDYDINNSTGSSSVTTATRLISKLTTATAASEVSQFEIWGVNSGVLAKKFSIAGSGQLTADGYGAGTFTGTPTGTAQFTSSGNVIEGPIVAAGTYTPTLTNGTNVNSSTASSCQYMRVGNTVTVSGKVNITPTSSGATALGISLPIASSIANDNECGGTGTVGNTTDLFGSIRGDATNDRAELYFTIGVTGTTSAQDWYFSFTYRIL